MGSDSKDCERIRWDCNFPTEEYNPGERGLIVSMSEREKKEIAKAVDEALKPFDISAEERHYQRSRKIRRRLMKWLSMEANSGKLYAEAEDIWAQSANFAKCSSTTARRWIYQFTQPDMPFAIAEHEAGYVIWRRSEMEQ